MGSSRPQDIGNFMRANGLSSDRIEVGRNYFVPESTTAYGDSASLGQYALNQGNERVAAARAASVASGGELSFDGVGSSFADVALGGSPSFGASSLSALQRTQAHALGVYDAGAGAVEAAGYSFGVVGTPESRAAWAVKTAEATVEGIRRFANDPGGTVSAWWGNLTGDDPAAIRQATAQGAVACARRRQWLDFDANRATCLG